jgi:hypothetical protein
VNLRDAPLSTSKGDPQGVNTGGNQPHPYAPDIRDGDEFKKGFLPRGVTAVLDMALYRCSDLIVEN